MNEAFSRTSMLIGEDGVERLRLKHVAVFGVGGVGGYVVEALARAGVGAFTLVDGDKVSLSNINRQIIALHSTVGLKKVEVCKARVTDINPQAAVETRDEYFSEQTADRYDFSKFDYVVDAVDSVGAKLLLVQSCKSIGTPIICAMGAGNKITTDFISTDISKTSICPLAKVMRRELRKIGVNHLNVVYSPSEVVPPISADGDDVDGGNVEGGGAEMSDAGKTMPPKKRTPGSISFAPAVCGLVLASKVLEDLLKSEQ